ncbi:MAG: cobalt ECF transporter T component CbiQ [Methanomassiliicoccaceae archaeon]|nr:cobalt ECF transporter T component CbiQ [Methanomassiliicoccaceae archaeon]
MHGNELNTVDTAAYRSPMLRWPALAKLFLIISLLVLNIASPSVWMSVFSGVIGFFLFLYASSLRPPSLMVKLFVYAQIFIIIGTFIFTIVTPGTSVFVLNLYLFKITITDAGISFALLLYARATAALFLMFSFALSTPIPYLANALKRLRLPDVFVEMTILIYRYTFLLIESAERMHLAAECKFGYSSYKKSMRTTARLAVGVFMRSLDTAEKGQITLQCRNYNGNFISLSEHEEHSSVPSVVCLLIACAGIIFFFALRMGMI